MMIVSFAKHFNIRLGEWLASLILVSFAVLFFSVPGLFERSPAYYAGLLFVRQPVWGFVFAALGLIRIIALYINGRRSITPYIRMVLAFVSCFVWWQVTIGLFASGMPGFSWATLPWLLALDMYNVFRSSADARQVYDKQRASKSDGTGQA